MPRLRHAVAAPRVAVAVDDAAAASDMARILAARGLAADAMPVERALDSPGAGATAVAYAPDEPTSPELAARLAPYCRAGAQAESPVIMLSAFPRATGKTARLRAAALAYLRAWGAVVCTDPDEWLETICLIAGHGIPPGPRVAIVAPEGSWLGASATSLANEAELLGSRFPAIATSASR